MKPVVMGLCLVLLFIAGTVSVSLGDCPTCGYTDTNPYAGCPTCVFEYDSEGLADPNPYAGCPTCVFAYGPDGLLPSNPYTGCPTCVYDYNSYGIPTPSPTHGCPTCGGSSGTTNTLGASVSFISSSSPSTVYRFPDGTAIPEDYLCPVHGIYCPDDPRPLEERPGYVAPVPTILPAHVPFFHPGITTELSTAFGRSSSHARSDRLELFPDRVLERPR